MTKRSRNQLAVKDFSKHIKALKRAHHSPVAAVDLQRWAWVNLDANISNQTCLNALNGDLDPTACSTDILMTVSGFFGVQPSELGTFAERRLAAVLAYARPLLSGDSDPDDPEGPSIGESSSACTRWPLRLVSTSPSAQAA